MPAAWIKESSHSAATARVLSYGDPVDGPSFRVSIANFRNHDAPLVTKLGMVWSNILTKLRTRSSCCGNYGQPGC